MWVTLREAAGREGISEKTVRKWARDGRWATRRIPWRGATRIEVDLPEGEGPAPAAGDLVELLKAQLEEKDRQISELHQLMAQQALNAAPARRWWAFWR